MPNEVVPGEVVPGEVVPGEVVPALLLLCGRVIPPGYGAGPEGYL
jgi:hypothetical protein